MAKYKTVSIKKISNVAAAYTSEVKAAKAEKRRANIARRAEYTEMSRRIRVLAASYAARYGVKNRLADMKVTKRPTQATIYREYRAYVLMQEEAERKRKAEKEAAPQTPEGPGYTGEGEEGRDFDGGVDIPEPPVDLAVVQWLIDMLEQYIDAIQVVKAEKGFKSPGGPVFNLLLQARILLQSASGDELEALEKALEQYQHTLETDFGLIQSYSDNDEYVKEEQDKYTKAASDIFYIIEHTKSIKWDTAATHNEFNKRIEEINKAYKGMQDAFNDPDNWKEF